MALRRETEFQVTSQTIRSVSVTDVSRSEWRWVIIFSGLLVALTLIPYGWTFASNVGSNSWQFMGILHNHQDGATYLSKIGEGARGSWLFTLEYTPEDHSGAVINEYYIFLGHLSNLLGLRPLLMFHIARLVASLIMYIAIYQLGSTIWQRLRARRLFFGLMAVGSGLGWLVLMLLPKSAGLSTDFIIPESIPFYATLANPHFPIAIALIALLAANFVKAFHPGFDAQPTLANGGMTVVILSTALCIIQPQGWVPIAVAVLAYIGVQTLSNLNKKDAENSVSLWKRLWKAMPQREISWALLMMVPAIPFFTYYLAVVNQNWAMKLWNSQNQTFSPSVDKYLIGFGLLLLVALPGIVRAMRRFERDGDRFMLIWLITNSILLYIPVSFQRRFAIGLIIPIVYFAVRALEDYWFYTIKPRWRDASLVALFVFIIPSNVFVMTLPIFGIMTPSSGLETALLLPTPTFQAIRWLGTYATSETVVLAKPATSLWIPAYSALRVVYGHPYETLNAAAKLDDIKRWYGDQTNPQDCRDIAARNAVRYVVVEPESADTISGTGSTSKLGTGETCVKALGLEKPIATFGDGSTAIYEIR